MSPTVLPRWYGARTIANAHWQDFWRSHDLRALVLMHLIKGPPADLHDFALIWE